MLLPRVGNSRGDQRLPSCSFACAATGSGSTISIAIGGRESYFEHTFGKGADVVDLGAYLLGEPSRDAETPQDGRAQAHDDERSREHRCGMQLGVQGRERGKRGELVVEGIHLHDTEKSTVGQNGLYVSVRRGIDDGRMRTHITARTLAKLWRRLSHTYQKFSELCYLAEVTRGDRHGVAVGAERRKEGLESRADERALREPASSAGATPFTADAGDRHKCRELCRPRVARAQGIRARSLR